jgi:hypothetical protein
VCARVGTGATPVENPGAFLLIAAKTFRRGVSFLVLASLTLVSAAALAAAEADWTLAKTSDDGAIEIYQRDSPNGFREFRARTRVRSSLGEIIALFTDVQSMDEWVYRTREVQRLDVISEQEIYAYTIIDLPWPFNDRDAVLHIVVEQDPQSYVVTIHIESVAGYGLENEQRVRMPRVKSTWTVVPVEDDQVEVTFQGYGDPGGNLSSPLFRWYVDLTSWEAPMSTLTGLRRQVASGRHRDRRVPYIQERP